MEIAKKREIGLFFSGLKSLQTTKNQAISSTLSRLNTDLIPFWNQIH